MKYEPLAIRGTEGCSPVFYEEYRNLIKGKVLDFGCGNTKFRKELESDFKIEYTGIDFDPIAEPHLHLKMDVDTHLPYEDKTIDVVIALSFMEYLTWDVASNFIKEIYRVLKDDGIFIFESSWWGNDKFVQDQWTGTKFGHSFEMLVRILEQNPGDQMGEGYFKSIFINRVYNNRILGHAKKELRPNISKTQIEEWEGKYHS